MRVRENETCVKKRENVFCDNLNNEKIQYLLKIVYS